MSDTRELDEAVAREVMGLTLVEGAEGWYHCDPKRYPPGSLGDDHSRVPDYSTSIAAAFEVVEKMREKGLHFALDNRHQDGWWAEFASIGYARGGQATADSAPLAIVKAALEAVRANARSPEDAK